MARRRKHHRKVHHRRKSGGGGRTIMAMVPTLAIGAVIGYMASKQGWIKV